MQICHTKAVEQTRTRLGIHNCHTEAASGNMAGQATLSGMSESEAVGASAGDTGLRVSGSLLGGVAGSNDLSRFFRMAGLSITGVSAFSGVVRGGERGRGLSNAGLIGVGASGAGA